jgi:GDPmannose 4,6-dehydratase
VTNATKRALITGITGQDGAYLTEFLLGKGYEVHGLLRRASLFNTDRIDHIYHDPHVAGPALRLHYGDLSDGTALRRVLEKVQPHEIYNLAAQSHVKVSFEIPEYTADIVAVGTLRLLEAVRDHMAVTGAVVRCYQAGSSEMFGSVPPPQSERTPFHPRSPYAVSKLAAHWYAVNYREAYGMFVCNGILFNHESPRRGETFVSRKITRAVGRIKEGLQEKVYLGNLEARRDWGFAGDYVEAMWLMLQQETADDYVVATGVSHSVRDLADAAFAELDMDWRDFVAIDERYLRPAEVDALEGDASKAREKLGWRPRVDFAQLVTMMVAHDHDLARQEKTLKSAGFGVAQRGAAQR